MHHLAARCVFFSRVKEPNAITPDRSLLRARSRNGRESCRIHGVACLLALRQSCIHPPSPAARTFRCRGLFRPGRSPIATGNISLINAHTVALLSPNDSTPCPEWPRVITYSPTALCPFSNRYRRVFCRNFLEAVDDLSGWGHFFKILMVNVLDFGWSTGFVGNILKCRVVPVLILNFLFRIFWILGGPWFCWQYSELLGGPCFADFWKWPLGIRIFRKLPLRILWRL